MKSADGNAMHKETFQMERIALFSDAIFAIAITLLIIEIKVPEIEAGELSDSLLWHNLVHILPKFIGFLISFFVIGLYWLSHHRMFKYVVHSNQKLLWNNLLFMLPIVIMPFSTAFLSENYSSTVRLPLAVYTANICFAGFFSFRLWKIIGDPKNHLSQQLHRTVVKYNLTRSLFVPGIFIAAFLISFISPFLSYIIPPFALFATKIIKSYYGRKYPAIMQDHLA